MRRDPRYQQARLLTGRERTDAFRQLRREYGLTEYGACGIARRHWQASGWMSDLVDGRSVHALASELMQNVDEWLYGRARKLRFKPADSLRTVWGESDQAGLVLRDGRVRWNTRRGAKGKLARKSLSLSVDWGAISRARREHVQSQRVVRVGVQREQVRGRERWFVLLCLEGLPYRNPSYLEQVKHEAAVGLDLGPSALAVVGAESGELIPLISRDELEREHEQAKHRRRQQRALDRSRRATNPDAFDKQGRYRPGKKIAVRSKRYQQRQARLREQERVQRVKRVQQAATVARRVATHGTVGFTEKVNVAGWQSGGLRLGKRIGLTAPGLVQQRVARELALHGGSLTLLPTQRLALSQHCLCGARERKSLEQRRHECASCGLGPLDRDLFSAFMAREAGVTGLVDLGEAPFLGTAGIQERAERLCAVPRRARGLTRTTRSEGTRTRSRANATARPRRQHSRIPASSGPVSTPRKAAPTDSTNGKTAVRTV
jgi:transposase